MNYHEYIDLRIEQKRLKALSESEAEEELASLEAEARARAEVDAEAEAEVESSADEVNYEDVEIDWGESDEEHYATK